MEDRYTFLGGVLTEFKDGGLALRNDPVPPPTQSVLILGTATDGPVMEPVAVDSTTVYQLFGKVGPGNGTLVRAFEEAYAGGCRDIRLMRISGKHATGALKLGTITDTYEAMANEFLGTKAGNDAMTITLGHKPDAGTPVVVYANGAIVPTSAYTVDYDAGTVELKENTVDVGASLTIEYTYTDPDLGQTVVTTESAGYATGSDQTFTLANVPKTGTLVVLLDGNPVDSGEYSLNGNVLTLKATAGKLGATVRVEYLYDVVETKEPEVPITSIFGGSVYNRVQYAVQALKDDNGNTVGKQVIIRKPPEKQLTYGDQDLVYSSEDYPTLGELVEAINNDQRNNVVRLQVSEEFRNLPTKDLVEMLFSNLVGGDDGLRLNRVELYNALNEAYHLLENYNVDYIVVDCAYADDLVPGQKHDMPFAYQLALACAVISHRNRRVHGFIATSSPDDPGLSAVKAHVDKLEQKSMEFYMRDKLGNVITDSDGNPIDLGGYITVVAGPDVVISTPSRKTYARNSAAFIAGFISTLPPQSAPTNKTLEKALRLRYTYSLAQLNTLVGKRYLVLKTKANGTQVAIEDAPTAAQPGSDYTRLSTVRAVKLCVDDVREIADPFIGEPNSVNNRNAFAAALEKRLNARKESGAITDYDFRLIVTPADLVLGQMKVELSIVPPFELRRITTVVSLTPEL